MSANGRVARGNGLGSAVGDVALHVRRIASLERELAVAEMTAKAETVRPALVFAGAAGLLGLLAAGMGAATAAALLALVLPWWASLLIVSTGMLALAGTFTLVAVARFRAAAPLVPEAAIDDARETVDRVADRVG